MRFYGGSIWRSRCRAELVPNQSAVANRFGSQDCREPSLDAFFGHRDRFLPNARYRRKSMQERGVSLSGPNVSYGSKAEVGRWRFDVRYAPNSGSRLCKARQRFDPDARWSKTPSDWVHERQTGDPLDLDDLPF